MRMLGVRQQKKFAFELVEFINSSLCMAFPEPTQDLYRDDDADWCSSIKFEDSQVGPMLIAINVDQLGLFLHIRIHDPKRFDINRAGYNKHSGKYNFHRHRHQYDTFDGFLEGTLVDAEDHVRNVVQYQMERSAA